MSFLLKSDLKKHLSTKSGSTVHHAEPLPAEGARVVLRDGNLITLPAPLTEQGIVTAPVL